MGKTVPVARAAHRVLVVDPEPAVRQILASLLGDFCRVALAATGEEALALAQESNVDLLVVHERLRGGMSTKQLLLEMQRLDTTPAFILAAHPSSGAQAREMGAVMVSRDLLSTEMGRTRLVLLVERAASEQRHSREAAFRTRQLDRAVDTARKFLSGTSAYAASLRDKVAEASGSTLNLLLTGETGVGKTFVAEVVHYATDLGRQRPFVPVHPSALAPSLFESELFGRVAGAYTGATKTQVGAFEAADGGTLFLDEIGELDPQLQVKLLWAVESRVIRRLGDPRDIKLDVRLIAATNRDLDADMATGKFRADLLQRLNGLHIHMAPLRERREDIAPLLQHFLAELGGVDTPPEISRGATESLTGYSWPGNVRELRTLSRRIVERGVPAAITEETLRPVFPARVGGLPPANLPIAERVTAFERGLYMEELSKHGFNLRNAARALNLPYHTLRSRLLALGLLDRVRNEKKPDRGGRPRGPRG